MESQPDSFQTKILAIYFHQNTINLHHLRVDPIHHEANSVSHNVTLTATNKTGNKT